MNVGGHSTDERLYPFLANGLPVILASAEGFWGAAQVLKGHPREADVLEGFACEEAGKALILIDMLRCPRDERSKCRGEFVRRFYDHLARLLYAEAVKLKPASKGQLRTYINRERRTHDLTGSVGEYIVPSGPIHDRGQRLYADVEAVEGGELFWSAPGSWKAGLREFSSPNYTPAVLGLARSMQRLGMFTAPGLKAVADIWGSAQLDDTMRLDDAQSVTEALLKRLVREKLITEEATEADCGELYSEWPFPMWDFDLKEIIVPLDELEAERDRTLWNEAGY